MKNINARVLSLSTSWTIVLIVFMTIVSELHMPIPLITHDFKDLLTSITGHHWVTKSIISVIFFVVLYKVLVKKTKSQKNSQSHEMAVVWVTVLSGLIIFIFYLWHYLAA